MSLLDSLNAAKTKLKPVEIRVLLADGTEISEKRGEDGRFQENNDVSNKRKKKVERLTRLGFVVDLKPDLQLAECSKGVFLGSQDVAADLVLLKNSGITHIINVATGISNFFPKHFRYFNIELLDIPTADIQSHLFTVTEYIHEVLSAGGKVFVHCNAGISRSATFVVAYIMKYEKLSLPASMEKVQQARPVVKPNTGFMQQLLSFEIMLQESNTASICKNKFI